MATAAFLLVSVGLFTVVAGEYCRSYIRGNEIMPSVNCYDLDCCGTCDDRKCCYIYLNFHSKLSEADQAVCDLTSSTVVIVSGIVGLLFTIAMFIVCCCCPCCCIYKMCKKPRPVAGPQITTVMSTQCIQQQNTSYQPVPTQQGYGAQPVHMGPAYQGQPYAPGPPPSYHMAVSPGYPPYQAGCSRDQAAMQPHMQPGNTDLPSEISSQPAYNPAYMQPPKPGY